LDHEAGMLVAGDEVARPGGGAANHGVRRILDVDTKSDVADRVAAGGIGADPVALDGGPGRRRALHVEAILGVAGDDVAGSRGGPADDGVRRILEVDTVAAVAERAGAGGVGADVVAADDVARSARALDDDAGDSVAGDDVALARRGPANDV